MCTCLQKRARSWPNALQARRARAAGRAVVRAAASVVAHPCATLLNNARPRAMHAQPGQLRNKTLWHSLRQSDTKRALVFNFFIFYLHFHCRVYIIVQCCSSVALSSGGIESEAEITCPGGAPNAGFWYGKQKALVDFSNSNY